MSHLDIVHILSAYVHVIHILSEHVHIIHTLSAVVLDMFLPNRQCRCYPYVISSTLYISYHVQLSFHTLSTHTHIVHVICMLSAHVHIICFSSLTLLIYPIIHNLVSVHIVSIQAHCRYHLFSVYRCICYVHLISTAVICIYTCQPRTIWAYAYYAHIICSGPWYIPS